MSWTINAIRRGSGSYVIMNGDALTGSICKVDDGYNIELRGIVSLQPSLDHARGFVQGVEVTLENLTNERVDASHRRAEIHAGLYELFLERKTAPEH